MNSKDTIFAVFKEAVLAAKNLDEHIKQLSEKFAAETELATVSSFGFVRVFGSVAHELSEMQITPYTENYVSLCKEATKMLASGMEQADVLWHFDELLRKTKGNLATPCD